MPLLNKIVGSLLKLFVKNYTSRHLSLDVLKGEVVLRGIELNEKVLQGLMMLPPNLELRRAQCGYLRVKIPWRKLRKEPVVVVMEVVIADIVEHAEPVYVPPLPPKLARFLPKKAPSSSTTAATSQQASAPKTEDPPSATPTPQLERSSTPQPTTAQHLRTASSSSSSSTAGGSKQKQQQPQAERESGKKAIPAFLEAALEGISVQISGVFFNMVLLGVPEGDNWKGQLQCPPANRRPLPPITVSLESLSIKSTNSKWELVDLPTATKEGNKNGEVVVRKEVKLGALSIELAKTEILRVHPSVTHVTLRRMAAEAIPMEISIEANFPLVSVCFTGDTWTAMLESIQDIRWCIFNSKAMAAQRALEPLPTPTFSVSPSPRDADDKDGSDSVSELSEGDIDFNGLARELDLGSDTSSTTSDVPSISSLSPQPAASPSPSRAPLIQLNVCIEKAHAKWPGVALVALTNVALSSSVERTPVPDDPADALALASGLHVPKPKRRFVVTSLVRLAAGALGLSTDPGSMQVDGDPSVVYWKGESGLPFVEASFLLRKAPPGVTIAGPTAEVMADVGDVRFVPDTPHLRRLLEFFLGHNPFLVNPPSKSTIADKIGWLDTAKFKLTFAGLLLDTQVERGGPRFCIHAGPISVAMEPSPLSPLSSFPPSEVPPRPHVDRSASPSLDDSGEPEIIDEEIAPRHGLLHCELGIGNVWIGQWIQNEEKPRYLLHPFQVDADVLLFQPITLVSYAVQGRRLLDGDRSRFASAAQMPAIHVALKFGDININLRQSNLLSARTAYRIVADYLLKVAKKKQAENKQKRLKQEGAAATEPATLGKKLKMLRHVVSAKMASRIPCRGLADVKLSKTGLTISCPPSSLKQSLEFLYGVVRAPEPLSGIVIIETLSRLLFDTSDPADVEIDLAAISFEEVEGKIVYEPPPIPTLAALISAEMQHVELQESQVPLVEGTFVFSGYGVTLHSTAAFPIEAFMEPRHRAPPLPTDDLFSDEELRPASLLKVVYQLTAKGDDSKHRIVGTLAGVNVNGRGIPPKKFISFAKGLVKKVKKAKRAAAAERAAAASAAVSALVIASDDEKQKPKQKQRDRLGSIDGSGSVTRIVDTHTVTIDLELCDMDVRHLALLDVDSIETFVKLVPQTDAVVRGLRDKLTAKLRSVEERRVADVARAESELKVVQSELAATERMLVEMKMGHATALAELDEANFGCMKAKKAAAAATQHAEKLQAEITRCYGLLQAKFSDVPVNEFRSVIQELSAEGARLTIERDQFSRETTRLKGMLQNLKETSEAAKSESQRIITAKEDELRAAKVENYRLQRVIESSRVDAAKTREVLEMRSQQLAQTQEEKRSLEDEVARLKEQLAAAHTPATKLRASALSPAILVLPPPPSGEQLLQAPQAPVQSEGEKKRKEKKEKKEKEKKEKKEKGSHKRSVSTDERRLEATK